MAHISASTDFVLVEHKGLLTVAGEAEAGGAFAQRRYRIGLGTANEENGAVGLARQRADQHLEADGQREGLVRLLAAEGDEVVLRGIADENVAVRDPAHGDVRHEWLSVRARNRDRERVRADELRAAVRVGEAGGRGGGENADEAALRKLAHPVAEHPRGEAVPGDDHARVLRRVRQLSLDDARERDVAERAAALPPFEPRPIDDALGLRLRIEPRERREPADARDAVTALPPRIGVEEVVREDGGIGLGEAERPKTRDDFVRAQAGTSGSDFTMPTPCSRFVAAIDSARPMIARVTSSPGAASTIGSPLSA